MIFEDKNDLKLFFRENFEAYKDLYFNFIFRMVNDYHTAEDILQDSIIKILKNLDRLKDSSKFKSWSMTIIANTCRDWIRKKKKIVIKNIEDIENIKDKKILITDKMSLKKTTEIIKNALKKLDIKEREIFILKHYNKIKYIEIANILGISERSVQRKMKSATIKIISEMERLKFIKGNHFNFTGGNEL